jgi:hypothetical protein
MGVLPPRPLRLDPAYLARVRRKHWLMSALLLVVGGGFLTGCFFFTREVLEERALWERGVAGDVESVSGDVTEYSKLGITFLYEYALDVSYVDAEGAPHRGESKFDLLWSPLAGDLQGATLRYDPADPARFVLSSPIEAGWPRWGLSILMGTLAGLMLVGLALHVRGHSRSLRAFALCAEDGVEFVTPLLSLTRQQKTIWLRFSVPHRQKPVKHSLQDEPLVIERDGASHVVVLSSPRDRDNLVVLRADLAPFAFDVQMKAKLLEQVETTRG